MGREIRMVPEKMSKNSKNAKQPKSIPNDNPYIWDLVTVDIKERNEFGARKHGTRLHGLNGYDALEDAYEEALGLVSYLRQALYVRDGL